jgi:hypothetical protein
MVPAKSAWFSECVSTRACRSHRRERLGKCEHLHRTRESAQRCAYSYQRKEQKAGRRWRPVKIVWFLFENGDANA